LVTAHGDVPQWGNVHHYRFKHQVFEATPLKCVASASIAGPGGSSTVNVADSSLVDHVTGTVITGVAPNYRFITDMATNKSWVMLNTGQDGNMLTNEYDEYLQSWKDVKYFEVDLQQEMTHWRYQQELVPKK
jgi:acyl-homoserine lactone acylase PvdQ